MQKQFRGEKSSVNCSDCPPVHCSQPLILYLVSSTAFSQWVCYIQISEAKTFLLRFVTFLRTGNNEQCPTNHHTCVDFPIFNLVLPGSCSSSMRIHPLNRMSIMFLLDLSQISQRGLLKSLGWTEVRVLIPLRGFPSGDSSASLPCCSLLPISVMPSSCGKCCLDGYLMKVLEVEVVCVCV